MKIFLAGCVFNEIIRHKPPFVLLTFYDLRKAKEERVRAILNSCEMFLLDSGAFTFLNSGKKVDFDEYLQEYINFINKYDIKYFFELDIDAIVGLEKVEQMRAKLELQTKKKCIPVWHKSRGVDYFVEMCKNYKYVSLGGIAAKEFKQKEHKTFTWFINTAHKYGAEIHGLGYTSLKNLNEGLYKFDSVDSTSWLGGGRFGQVYGFKDGKLQNIQSKTEFRVNAAKLREHNLIEWLKFVKSKR